MTNWQSPALIFAETRASYQIREGSVVNLALRDSLICQVSPFLGWPVHVSNLNLTQVPTMSPF